MDSSPQYLKTFPESQKAFRSGYDGVRGLRKDAEIAKGACRPISANSPFYNYLSFHWEWLSEQRYYSGRDGMIAVLHNSGTLRRTNKQASHENIPPSLSPKTVQTNNSHHD